MPIPAPNESDKASSGTGGPLGRSTSTPAKPAPDDGWRPVPGKPYLQENARTGQLRTANYQPTTRIKPCD